MIFIFLLYSQQESFVKEIMFSHFSSYYHSGIRWYKLSPIINHVYLDVSYLIYPISLLKFYVLWKRFP
jgi:hypothetical protein